jgi:glycerol-3-phosphate acyltransferase PlsY
LPVGSRLGARRLAGAARGAQPTEPDSLLSAGIVAGAYLLGSVPTGILIGRRHGIDVRSVGSGNIGATNVSRALGRRAGILTLLGDVSKGAFPQLVCQALGLDLATATYAGLASVVGHLFPIFGRFRGGKGVATAFGVVFVLSPPAAVGIVAVFAVTAASTRYVSVASMVAASALPFALSAFDEPWLMVRMGIGFAALIVWRHRENLARLMEHSEPRF